MTPSQNYSGSVTWRLTPDLVGILDKSGIFKFTNPAWYKTLGRLPEDVESRYFLDFVHPEDVAKTGRAFVAIQAGQPILKFENRYRHKDGSYRWLSWNAVPDDDVFFCSARDVTSDKENESALKTRNEEAIFRDQFIAVLGHDLRNPLTAVGSAMRLISGEPQTERSQKYIDMTGRSLDRMAGLIDDVMDFARARLGDGLAITPQDSTVIQPFLEQVVSEIRLGHPSVPIDENYQLDTPFRCDPDRISQLLSNLLANALTHGDGVNPIEVSVIQDSGNFAMSVRNSGEPIPKIAQEMLFQPFTRAYVRESQQGLGLGLFIAREIAQGHHGALTVSSALDWTEFTFTMPIG